MRPLHNARNSYTVTNEKNILAVKMMKTFKSLTSSTNAHACTISVAPLCLTMLRSVSCNDKFHCFAKHGAFVMR